jgi:hypothetical protein
MMDNIQTTVTSVDGASVVLHLSDQLLSSVLKIVNISSDTTHDHQKGITHNSHDQCFKFYNAVVGSSVRFVLNGLHPQSFVEPKKETHLFSSNTSIEMVISEKDYDQITLENLILNVRIDLKPSEFQKYVIGTDDLQTVRHFSNLSVQSIVNEGGDLLNQIHKIFQTFLNYSSCDIGPTKVPSNDDNLPNFYPTLSFINFADNIEISRHNGNSSKPMSVVIHENDVVDSNCSETEQTPFIVVSRDYTTIESLGSLVSDLERFFGQTTLDTARKTRLMMM